MVHTVTSRDLRAAHKMLRRALESAASGQWPHVNVSEEQEEEGSKGNPFRKGFPKSRAES